MREDRPAAANESTKRRAAVLGSPIRHSLSPALHSAAYAALGLTGWRYDAFDCDEAALPTFIEGLGPEWAGLSLTMPLKRVALTVADEVSPLASAVGAANTLVLGQPGDPCRAENTDVAGISAALREAGLERVRVGVILGAGGTAQAALAALRELGEVAPTVLVRDPNRTAELRAAADRLGVQPMISGGLFDMGLPEADVVISTLPPGAADTLSCQQWVTRPVVLDVVYTPWPTELARSAITAGCQTVSGLAVLLHQAVAQVELMTGRCAPVAQMRAALDAAVQSRSTPS
ncbi:MAG: shikimate dehydrogenase [Actinomycetota bacterium]|nr:shikimate dehydrogenase [Actinomycetota bacterium]